MSADPKPVRLQLRRIKGFDLQALSLGTNGLPAVNCARPGPFGNPHLVGKGMSAEHACIHFRAELMRLGYIIGPRRTVKLDEIRAKLAGNNLACFCPLSSPHCHVETLLIVANDPSFKPEVDRGN